MKPTSRAAAYMAVFGGVALFSGMDAVVKGLSLSIGVYNALFWRCIAAIAISGLFFLAEGAVWPGRTAMRFHIVRGLVGSVMAFLFFWGLVRVPLAQGVALCFIAPIIALFLAAIILKERVQRRTILASMIALGGVIVIAFGQSQAADQPRASLLGTLSVLGSAGCYAWNIILMRQQAQVAQPAEISFFQSLIAAIVLLFFAPWFAILPEPRFAIPIVGSALLAVASLLLFSWGYARAEANHLATIEYTAFIWAALLGYLMFGEHVSLSTLLGSLLIVAGCLLAIRRFDPRADAEART